MDETSILQSVCSCIGGQQNVSRVLSSGNKRYLMVKDASAVDLTAVRQVEGVQAAELSRGKRQGGENGSQTGSPGHY